MSGEGSSSGVSRKRRASTRSRGTAEAQQQPIDVVVREIRYRRPGIPHRQSTIVQDSPLLQFAVVSSKYTKLRGLIDVRLLKYHRIDWELVGRLGQRERIEQLLGDKFRLVLDCDAPQYLELVLEFHSTFEYRHDGGFEEQDVVSFSLGRTMRNMTLPEFAELGGFYYIPSRENAYGSRSERDGVEEFTDCGDRYLR
ncbi:hypothetical protein Hdeb2414_s0038g00734181 [Helianthus debilis subsp. tardiflorus]